MSTQMRAFLASGLGELRYEPIGKRIRAVLGDRTAVDSSRAALVWEPRRVVPRSEEHTSELQSPC